MKKNVLILVLFTILFNKGYGQWQWAKGRTEPYPVTGQDICLDPSGNIYVVASGGSAPIGWGAMTFTAKYDPLGNAKWYSCDSTMEADHRTATAICYDGMGYIYSAGSIDPMDTLRIGTYVIPGPNYLIKYDTLGNIIWANRTGAGHHGMKADAAGNIYIASDSVRKFDSNGNVLWAINVRAQSLTIDNSGNIYVLGRFNTPTIIVGSDTLTNINTTTPDFYVVRIDSNGNIIWVESAGCNANINVGNITTDNFGNVYIVGGFYNGSVNFGTVTINSGATWEGFVAKYDSGGTVLWANGAYNNTDILGNIIFDGVASLYLSGGYTGINILKMDLSGNVIGTLHMGD